MSDDGNYKVQVSLSAPPSAAYAKGSMANFRGATVSEVVEQLQEAQAAGLLELASEVEAVWTAAAGVGARTESVQPAQNSAQSATVTPINQGASSAPAPSCQHGTKTWRSGKGSTGTWQAWFCPARKGDPSQCKPDWRNPDGSAKD